jgi:hypothetical protein
MFLVRIHIKTKDGKGKKFENPARILLSYHKDGEGSWGPYRRMMQHQAIDMPYQAQRECKEDEYLEYAHPHRIGFPCAYKSWEALINDEKKFTEDPAWFAQLAKLQASFPQFNQPAKV